MREFSFTGLLLIVYGAVYFLLRPGIWYFCLPTLLLGGLTLLLILRRRALERTRFPYLDPKRSKFNDDDQKG